MTRSSFPWEKLILIVLGLGLGACNYSSSSSGGQQAMVPHSPEPTAISSVADLMADTPYLLESGETGSTAVPEMTLPRFPGTRFPASTFTLTPTITKTPTATPTATNTSTFTPTSTPTATPTPVTVVLQILEFTVVVGADGSGTDEIHFTVQIKVGGATRTLIWGLRITEGAALSKQDFGEVLEITNIQWNDIDDIINVSFDIYEEDGFLTGGDDSFEPYKASIFFYELPVIMTATIRQQDFDGIYRIRYEISTK